jgi:ketosteroid isomerase-like protein
MTEATDTTGAIETARAYYEALDAGDYDRFADLLASGVVHERPDRTIEGRDALVGFMRDDRPQKGTSHEVRDVYESSDGAAAEGRLRDADGNLLFEFADAFEFEDGRIVRVRTYTR